MEIGLCWYQNKNGSMWTYKLTYHWIVELETFFALATITYIQETILYEIYPTDDQVFNDFINDK